MRKNRRKSHVIYDHHPRLKALILTAIHAYAHLKLEQVPKPVSAGKAKETRLDLAWQYFAKQIGRNYSDFRSWAIKLDDERVQRFAECAVQEAYMNHVWLEEWLAESGYPEREKLMNALFPVRRLAFKEARINLNPVSGSVIEPAVAALSQAVMRQTSVIALIGADGMGKSNVLKGFAWKCREAKPARFEQILYFQSPENDWKSLDDVLTRFLVYKGYGVADWSLDIKHKKADQILEAQSNLVLLDAVDLNADDDLYDWLQHIPFPSKVVIAAKRDLPRLQECTIVCRLNPLNPRDYNVQYRSFLEELVHEFPDFSEEEIKKLLLDVEGNPLAMEMILAYYRSYRSNAASPAKPLSLMDVVRQSCAVLSNHARQVLYALLPFPEQANLLSLKFVANGSLTDGQFEAALDQLIALRLVKPIYDTNKQLMAISWSTVIREHAKHLATNQGDVRTQVFDRWIEYYANLAESVGYCPFEPEKLGVLDAEFDGLQRVLSYVAAHPGYEEASLRIASCTYFYFVRGHWATGQSPHRIAFQAARVLRKVDAELYHMAFETEWLAKRANFDFIHKMGYLERMEVLAEHAETTPRTRVIYLNTLAYYLCESDTGRSQAIELLKESIQLGQQIGTPHQFIASYRLALCYSKLKGHYLETRNYLGEAIQMCLAAGDERTATSMRLLLCNLILRLSIQNPLSLEDRQVVEQQLHLVEPIIDTIGDQNQRARLLEADGRYFIRLGQMIKGRDQVRMALEIYRRLGRKADVDEMEKLLTNLGLSY